MIRAAEPLTLLASMAFVNLAAAIVWGLLAGPARIAPRASAAMMVANLLAATSVSLSMLRDVVPGTWGHWLGDTLAVAAFALLGAAAPAVATRRLAWRLSLGVTLAAALALALAPYEGDLRWPVRILSVASVMLMLAASRDVWLHLRRAGVERQMAALLITPLALIALLMAMRGLESLAFPGRTQDLRTPGLFNLVFLWAALVLTLVQNATMAFLVLMRLMQRLRHLTERDPLTNTLNRRAFEAALAGAHRTWQRGRSYAVVMIDMDRFKQLNDTLGHAAGDRALRTLTAAVQPCLRTGDRLGRIGGEEFAVLLPDTDLAGAALVAERMRSLTEHSGFQWRGRDWPLSASFGVAQVEAADASGEAVLARADAGLYRAKAQGRNAVQADGG